jgi:hypothetical protein
MERGISAWWEESKNREPNVLVIDLLSFVNFGVQIWNYLSIVGGSYSETAKPPVASRSAWLRGPWLRWQLKSTWTISLSWRGRISPYVVFQTPSFVEYPVPLLCVLSVAGDRNLHRKELGSGLDQMWLHTAGIPPPGSWHFRFGDSAPSKSGHPLNLRLLWTAMSSMQRGASAKDRA